jgi:hypothetical protein
MRQALGVATELTILPMVAALISGRSLRDVFLRRPQMRWKKFPAPSSLEI